MGRIAFLTSFGPFYVFDRSSNQSNVFYFFGSQQGRIQAFVNLLLCSFLGQPYNLG